MDYNNSGMQLWRCNLAKLSPAFPMKKVQKYDKKKPAENKLSF